MEIFISLRTTIFQVTGPFNLLHVFNKVNCLCLLSQKDFKMTWSMTLSMIIMRLIRLTYLDFKILLYYISQRSTARQITELIGQMSGIFPKSFTYVWNTFLGPIEENSF